MFETAIFVFFFRSFLHFLQPLIDEIVEQPSDLKGSIELLQ